MREHSRHFIPEWPEQSRRAFQVSHIKVEMLLMTKMKKKRKEFEFSFPVDIYNYDNYIFPENI